MEVLNNSLNQTLHGNGSLTGTEDVIIDAGYQIVVPLLIGLAMTGFLLNSIILVSILTSSLLMRTRGHDKYLNIIISMVTAIPPINDPYPSSLQVAADTLTSLFISVQILCGSYLPVVHEVNTLKLTLTRVLHTCPER